MMMQIYVLFMERMLNQNDLMDLGVAAYADGLKVHAEEVSRLVQLLNAASPDDSLVAVVGDTCAPEIVRLRALAHVATEWSRYSTPLENQACQDFDGALDDLLQAWRDHQALRQSAAPVKELFASRMTLDRLRERVAILRNSAGG